MLYQNEVNIEATGWLATRLLEGVEKEWANDRRDEIARNRWDWYQNELCSRGLM